MDFIGALAILTSGVSSVDLLQLLNSYIVEEATVKIQGV